MRGVAVFFALFEVIASHRCIYGREQLPIYPQVFVVVVVVIVVEDRIENKRKTNKQTNEIIVKTS